MNELDILIDKTKVVKTADNTFRALFNLPAEATIFRGHFPEKAIVPGVVLIEAVRQATAAIIPQKVKLKEIKQIKFKGLVQPAEVITIDFTIAGADTLYTTKATLYSGSQLKAKMQLVLAAGEL